MQLSDLDFYKFILISYYTDVVQSSSLLQQDSVLISYPLVILNQQWVRNQDDYKSLPIPGLSGQTASLSLRYVFNIYPEPYLTYFLTSCLTAGYSKLWVSNFCSLFSYIKEYAKKDGLEFLIKLLIKNIEPPFLMQKFQKSNRIYTFPVPFRQVGTHRKIFFLFVQKPLRKLLREAARKFSLKSRLLFVMFSNLYFPENSHYGRALKDYLAYGSANRMYIHYRWRFK